MSHESSNPLTPSPTDPTAIFEHFRGNYGSELLTAAVAHFGFFRLLHKGVYTFESLQEKLGLQRRPAIVLMTALRAMGLVGKDSDGRLVLTELAREHLVADKEFYVGDYVGLAATSPGVLGMVERLRSNTPFDVEGSGAAFIYREGIESAMEREDLARHFTLALAGRAKNVAPVLAEKVAVAGNEILLDIGGGTGIYSIAFLRRHSGMRAIVVDLPHVLTLAREFAVEYGVSDRMEFIDADMFTYTPDFEPDIILLSNILHDWGESTCEGLVQHYAGCLSRAGRLLIHDVFLNDAGDGPLPVALYSAALFTLTEGRAYSVKEYENWLEAAGLKVSGPQETLVHCGVLEGRRAQSLPID